MFQYAVTLRPDSNGSLLVGFPDFPEANSVGDDVADALRNAVDALETALDLYFQQRRPIPLPSKIKKHQHCVALPALSAAKVLIWNEMHAQNLRKADMARLLGVHLPQVDRIFDLTHSSKIEVIERAAAVLGKKLTISLV